MRRCNARWQAESPSAQRRARRRSRAVRATSISPLRFATCTSLPADHAIAPSGPSATWSIHLLLGIGEDRTRVAPVASISTTLPSSPPVTMRVPSPADDRMPPSCRRDALLRHPPSERASSRSRLLAENERERGRRGNAIAIDRRPPVATGARTPFGNRKPSMRTGFAHDRHGSGDAGLEAGSDFLFRQMPADEHHAGSRASRRPSTAADDRRRGSCARPGTRNDRDRP